MTWLPGQQYHQSASQLECNTHQQFPLEHDHSDQLQLHALADLPMEKKLIQVAHQKTWTHVQSDKAVPYSDTGN